MRWLPGDVFVQFDHAITDRCDLDKPRRDGPIDQRLGAAPAVRVRVVVRGVTHKNTSVGQCSACLQVNDDLLVGIKYMRADVVGDLSGVTAVLVHGTQRGDVCLDACDLVVFAKAGRHVHDAGAVFGRDEVGAQYLPGVLSSVQFSVGEIVEDRGVAATDEVGAFERVDTLGRTEFGLVVANQGIGDDVSLAVLFEHCIINVGANCKRQVRRQRPRCGGPRDHLLTAVEHEGDGDRRVLTVLVRVVHAGFGVGQRRLAAPAVGQYSKALIDQALVVQRLERPHNALHVREVKRLVVVFEVDPASLATNVTAPLIGVLQNTRATRLVKLVNAKRSDFRVSRNAEFLFGLDLGRETVTIPAEATFDTLATHRLVARNGVFDVARQKMAVVRRPVCKGWAIVKDELVVTVRSSITLID